MIPIYTDFLGNPIKAGDEILIPLGGHRAATMERATVDEIIPLIQVSNTGYAKHVREDKQHTAYPATYRVPEQHQDIHGNLCQHNDPGAAAYPMADKAFVLRVTVLEDKYDYKSKTWQYNAPRRKFVKNAAHVVVANALV